MDETTKREREEKQDMALGTEQGQKIGDAQQLQDGDVRKTGERQPKRQRISDTRTEASASEEKNSGR